MNGLRKSAQEEGEYQYTACYVGGASILGRCREVESRVVLHTTARVHPGGK